MKSMTSPMLAALLASLGLLLLGALQSVIWNGSDAPEFTRVIARLVDPGPLLEPASKDLAQPTESYFGYGRLVVGLYALLIFVASAIRERMPRPAQSLFIALLVVAAAADVGAYWLSETQGPGLRRIMFWYIEVPTLVATTLLLTGVGISRLRGGESSRWLALCLPLVIATTAGLGYLPHGILLAIAISLALTRPSFADGGIRVKRMPRLQTAAKALSILLACLALGLAYKPTLRPGPIVEPNPLVVTEGLEGARLHIFNTGVNRMSWFLVGRERPWRPVPAFVVEHPESGLFVFDTGLPDAVAEFGEAGMHAPERWVIESRTSEDRMLPAQMRSAGLDPDAVHHVAVSHFHGDHVGQLHAFPNARLVGGRSSRSLFAGHGLDVSDREGVYEEGFESGISFGPFDATVDMLGDQSLVLIRDGGHASEGIMLLLALDEGPLLLAGDAVVHSDWLNSNDVQRIPVDPDRAASVRNQVRQFLASVPRASIAYGHDLRGIDCARRDIVCHDEASFRPETITVSGAIPNASLDRDQVASPGA